MQRYQTMELQLKNALPELRIATFMEQADDMKSLGLRYVQYDFTLLKGGEEPSRKPELKYEPEEVESADIIGYGYHCYVSDELLTARCSTNDELVSTKKLTSPTTGAARNPDPKPSDSKGGS